MPRPLRIDLPGIPQHVVQRGKDRQPCFFTEADDAKPSKPNSAAASGGSRPGDWGRSGKTRIGSTFVTGKPQPA